MSRDAREFSFRRPTLEDVGVVFDLIVRCDVDEYGSQDSDLEDLHFDWRRINLTQDAWLAISAQDRLLGYAAVVPWGPLLRFDLYLDPHLGSLDVGRELLERCELRAGQIVHERERTEGIDVKIYVAHGNEVQLALVLEAGFKVVRYHFQMQTDLNESLPQPEWPDGMQVRSVELGQDVHEIHALIQAAFEEPGRDPQSFDDWREFMMREDLFEPELWFLAVEKTRLVGACLCYDYSQEGWIRQLGVREEYRGMGIGRALLLHAFHVFMGRGQQRAGLTVASTNPGATAFYESVGMRRVRQYDEFEKRIESPSVGIQ
ncbi:MAG: GNAT family N-acetyltransferase [Anaerolineales bacterium]|nr:GNAT family N-acetyltransferase [Anaerolineales bacterium]